MCDYMKLKGGILYYSLLVIILSSSFTGFILLNDFYDNRLLSDTIIQDELRRNVYSAIDLYLSGSVSFEDLDSMYVNVFENNHEKVLLSKRRWGSYYVINSSSKWKRKYSERMALVGSDLSNQEPVALYLADEGRILSLSGNTLLNGTSYLPQGTIRVSSIEGQQFISNDPATGSIRKSLSLLPALNNEYLRFAESFLGAPELLMDSLVNILNLDSTKIANSFKKRTLTILNDTLPEIGNISLSGNIILWSVHPLVIDNTASLSDIIIFAPQLRLKRGFKGELQVYSLQSIIIEDSCRIDYPSQLCVLQNEKFRYSPSDTLAIKIGKNSYIAGGTVIKSCGLPSYLRISEGASVFGQVYCPGQVELYGKIAGSLYCREFITETPKAKYYNHLLNATIDYNALSEHFTGTDLIDKTNLKSVIKWME
jgi:hypothetical protein